MSKILDVLAEKCSAMKAGDGDRVVAQYTPDATTFTLAPPLRNTPESVRDASRLTGWFATFDGPVDYEITEPVVTESDNLAFVHGLARLTATPLGGTEPFTLWFRMTLCLTKVDGAWLIEHEHTSTPFYMDGSFRAAVDLTP